MWQAHGRINSCNIIANCIRMTHVKPDSMPGRHLRNQEKED